MGQKIATVLFVVIQCIFIVCALVVIREVKIPSFHVVGIATFLVAYYTLGAAARKLFDVYISACRKSYGKKGMMDL